MRGLVLGVLVAAVAWAPAPATADASPLVAQADVAPVRPAPAPDEAKASAAIDAARELIKGGDYDTAIERLRGAIAQARLDPEQMREAYLQLIKTYVFLGNKYRLESQGREMSSLNYRAARELIAEALAIPALRHMRAEPATDYPPEMIAFFSDVRAQLFGAFRVIELEPAGAVVLFDGDTLRPAGPGTPRSQTDVPIGRHKVVVRHPGFQDVAEDVMISAGATLERRYRLEKKRGAWWYASRGGAVAGLVGGAFALLGGKNGRTAVATPLPGAPPPPSR